MSDILFDESSEEGYGDFVFDKDGELTLQEMSGTHLLNAEETRKLYEAMKKFYEDKEIE